MNSLKTVGHQCHLQHLPKPRDVGLLGTGSQQVDDNVTWSFNYQVKGFYGLVWLPIWVQIITFNVAFAKAPDVLS